VQRGRQRHAPDGREQHVVEDAEARVRSEMTLPSGGDEGSDVGADASPACTTTAIN
jgi:hypothetical protein